MLTELVEYAHKNLADSEPGFTVRTVKWLVEISPNGGLVHIVPLGDDRKGEQTPKCPEMHNMNAGGRAHFLIETLQTVALLCKPNEEPEKVARSKKKHLFFRKMIERAAMQATALDPLARFLSSNEQVEAVRNRFVDLKGKPTDWLRWRIAGIDPLQQPSVLDWWRIWRDGDLERGKAASASPRKGKKRGGVTDTASRREMICFLTGERTEPLATQPKVTGLSGVGGLGTGDVVAGFDKAAFCSFDLEQASNAAMGEKPSRSYADALSHLIKNHSRKLANALVVHWFKQAIGPENDPLAFLYEPPEVTEATAQSAARQVLESLRTGQRPVPGNNRFFAMTLSGASGRVMVRDWMEGSFEDLVARIEQWFSSLEIVARGGDRLAPDPKFMALCGAIVRDLKDFPAPTAAILWRVALVGLPIPCSFLTPALARFRADLIDDKPFNHARMGLIKAYFIRKGGNHNMSAYLNKEHPEPAYQCGRLLATLAGLQRAALGDVGAGVVQRYYVAASQTPGLTLGRLVANAKNHLNKLDGGLAYWYEGQIAEILSRVRDRIPPILDLEAQSLFALGYYQQIAANRAGKGNDNEITKGDE